VYCVDSSWQLLSTPDSLDEKTLQNFIRSKTLSTHIQRMLQKIVYDEHGRSTFELFSVKRARKTLRIFFERYSNCTKSRDVPFDSFFGNFNHEVGDVHFRELPLRGGKRRFTSLFIRFLEN
jgi:hypothetical protein